MNENFMWLTLRTNNNKKNEPKKNHASEYIVLVARGQTLFKM